MITGPRADHQPLTEASSVNLPTLLCVIQAFLSVMWTLPSHRSDVMDAGPGSSAHGWHFLL